MHIPAIFLVSLSTLAFEVLLTRVFSIGQWNHLAFMVISIALFGFAASGTFLSILDSRDKNRSVQLSSPAGVTIIIGLFSTTALFSFYALTKIPMDYFRLPVEPVQSLYLISAYVLLALPFFFSGLLISLGYATAPQKSGLIYFATMAGSAGGAIIPAALLQHFGEERLIVATTALPLVLVLISASKRLRDPQFRKTDGFPGAIYTGTVVYSAALIILAVVLLLPIGSGKIVVKPSPYKSLSQILQFPETKIVETTTGIRGKNQKVRTRYIRSAPGISLKYTQPLPRQHALFRDGDNRFVFYYLKSSGEAQFATNTLSYSGYQLISNPQNVLVIASDGGLSIACAAASGAGNIRIAAKYPGLARAIENHYQLPVINQNPRAYLAQSSDQFQVIHVENWGASLAGSDALNQHHLLTTDAFEQYVNHLTPEGILIISRRLLLPPANTIRMWATAYEGLKKKGYSKSCRPSGHVAQLGYVYAVSLGFPDKEPGKISQIRTGFEL